VIRQRSIVFVAPLAAVVWLIVGYGLVNYDTLYALVWGRDLAHGTLPDYDLALAPTPHPLATLAGVVLAPLSSLTSNGLHGQAATTIAVIGAFVALALLGWVVYRLGEEWFGRGAGLLAAAIVLTRRPVLDYGSRVYVDIPYLVLVLGAVLVETRRRRAGTPVLLLLGAAGLIRPEAWLFSGAYVLWLWAGGQRDWRLVVLAAAAPLLWMLGDLAVTGDPLHSLTGTRDTAETLGRVTGLQHVPTTVPRRLGEILREPVLFGAFGGGVFSLLWLRERARLGAAVGVLAILAFSVLATAGLPILGRYLLLPATILALFCAAGVLGWRLLEADHPRRRLWQAWAALTVALLVVFTPSQVNRIRDLRHALRIQEHIQADLGSLVRSDAFASRCRNVTVPNHRPVPLLALWLDRDPQLIGSAVAQAPRDGVYVVPATPAIAKDYVLDPRDPVQATVRPPAGFTRIAANGSWIAYQRC
jgi:hypothetical protein